LSCIPVGKLLYYPLSRGFLFILSVRLFYSITTFPFVTLRLPHIHPLIKIFQSNPSPPTSYQGRIGAALVLGGVDSTGPHLFTIHPHGSTDKLPYVTMGSGSLAAMAVFERGWRGGMTVSFIFFVHPEVVRSSVTSSPRSPFGRHRSGERK
jgi:hypothetical protein